MIKVKFTNTNIGADIFNQKNGNTGCDIIMPMLNIATWESIKLKNELFHVTDEIWGSKKYPETDVMVFNSGGYIKFKGRLFVSTNIGLDLPKNVDCLIKNRSSNFNKNINVVEGLIDNPYTGEIGLQLNTISDNYATLNFSSIRQTKSYAQLEFRKKLSIKLISVDIIKFSELKSVIKKAILRGKNGFGSTGK